MTSGRGSSAVAGSVDILTLVVKLVAINGPHEEVAERNVGKRDNVGASDHDGSTRNAIVDCAGPVVECKAAQGNCSGVGCGMGFPILINI